MPWITEMPGFEDEVAIKFALRKDLGEVKNGMM